jgi:hypothetical protein
VACCSLLSIVVVILTLDAEKTIAGEGMISLLRVILFATRNYTAVFQGTYKVSRKYRNCSRDSRLAPRQVKNCC